MQRRKKCYLETTENIDIAADFEKDTYLKKDISISDPDYHLYAKWIEVGTVSKDSSGNKIFPKDYRYITNVNCTSNISIQNTYSNGQGMVAKNHRNYGAYRLYTLVITYEGDSEGMMGDMLDARAYIRYYDANGKLRVFYNDYNNANNETYYGGCMCSFSQVSGN